MRVPLRFAALAGLATLGLAGLNPGAPVAPAAAQAGQPGLTLTVDKVRFEPLEPPAPLSAAGVGAWRGALEVVRAPDGLAVVNDVGLEDYLRGIVEVPATWPTEALKAQVIAARTYALSEMASTAAAPWRAAGAHTCPTQACQVYQGVAGERRPGWDRWNAAVAATEGLVLLYRGTPIRAMYSSSNGGRSQAGGQPYLKAVDDPDDAASPLNKWRYTVPLETLGKALAVPAPSTVSRVSGSGGGVVIDLKAPDGTTSSRSMGGAEFLAKVNEVLAPPAGLPRPLPSSEFRVTTDGAVAVLDGRGYGHGVGMSQHGAYGKALRGMSAASILAAYYGGIRPTKVGPEQLPGTIRVAVAQGQRAVTVAGEGHFRVVAGSGRTLVAAGKGQWRVVPAKGGLRLTAPAGYGAPFTVEAGAAGAEEGATTSPERVELTVSMPAVATVRLFTPDAEPVVLSSRVVEGTGSVEVPQFARPPGPFQLLLTVDAGQDRQASVPLAHGWDRVQAATPPVPVAPPPAPVVPVAKTSAPAGSRPVAVWALVAGVLVCAGAIAVGVAFRRLWWPSRWRPPPPPPPPVAGFWRLAASR